MMKQDENYTFKVSLSGETFINKEISGAMIGTGKDENNRKIRENYGYDPNRGISFYRVELNSKELLQQLLEGRVFCHLFNPKHYRKDGSFGSSEKTNENFIGSYIIGVDVDKTSYNSMKDYIEKLSIKPTLSYTSYSNKQMGKGARFRLIYVFKELIENPYFFRYAATKLNNILEKETGELLEDECNKRCSQYFNGTNRYNSSIILDYDYTGNIYDLEDIGVSKEEYLEFIKEGAGYRTKTPTRKRELKEILKGLEPENIEEGVEEPEREPLCSRELIEAMKTLDYNTFMKYNRWKYKYIYRNDQGEWINETYKELGEKDFTLYYNVSKVKDGQKRRKKIFERICLRRVMNPEIDPDTLLFNAFEDRYRFFEIDKDLDIECLVRNVETALELEIPEIEQMYSKNLEFLRGRNKSRIILKSGEARNEVMKEIRFSKIDQYYDKGKTIKENLELLKDKTEVSERTLYRYVKERGIKIFKMQEEDIKEYINPKLSRRKNQEILKENGIKIKTSTLGRLLKELREEQ